MKAKDFLLLNLIFFLAGNILLLPLLRGQDCQNPALINCAKKDGCATITLSQPNTNTSCTNIDYSARDFIRISPGFKFELQAGQKFHAWADNNIVLPVEYATEAPLVVARTIDKSLPVGSIPGRADVTSTGGATYQIPIHIPPGTNGMQPNVSLVYNSQTTNGIAGWGWNIAGLSVITRVQQTLFHNNQIIGVNLTETDRFALDGNLLIVTNGGDYGADGTVYHTELETFNQITSYGNAGTGPEWFEVRTKQGLILEYGNNQTSTNSRFMGGSDVLFWRINKISDLNGNYVEYVYNNSDDESRIVEIKYTGNTGLDPYNSIKFYYSEREDQNENWIAGYPVKNHLILRAIGVFVEGKKVKEYELKHFNKQEPLSSERLYSFLGEIIEYNGSSNVHFNSTTFQYGDYNVQTLNNTIKESFPVAGTNDHFMSGDYNGDGRSDLLVAQIQNFLGKSSHTDYKIFLNDGNDIFNENFTYSNSFPAVYNAPYNRNTIIDAKSDFNGNGRDEFAVATFGYSYSYSPNPLTKIELYEINENNDNFSVYKTFDIPNGSNYVTGGQPLDLQYFPGDFDGDGAMDFILIMADAQQNYQATVYFPKLNISNIITGIGENMLEIEPYFKYVVDFNGDGKDEFMFNLDFTTIFIFGIEQNGAASYIHSCAAPSNGIAGVGDFNGDGRSDLLIYDGETEPVPFSVEFSTGTSYSQPMLLTDIGYATELFKIGDYNGDGKSDVLTSTSLGSTSDVSLYYFNGNSFKKQDYVINIPFNYDPFISGDFNGDGRLDELYAKAAQKTNILYFHPYEQDLLLIAVSNGLNALTEFSHTLVKRSPYHRMLGGITKNQNFWPIAVVNKMATPDGIGGVSNTLFTFAGNSLVYNKERGFMGFENVLISNQEANQSTEKKYQLQTEFYHLALSQVNISSLASNKKISSSLFSTD